MGIGRVRWRSEAGQVFVVTLAMMTVLLGMAAVAIDIGNLYVQKRTLQKNADATALAAAHDLTGLPCDVGTTCNTTVGASATKFNAANSAGAGSLHPCADAADRNCYKVPYVDKSGVSHNDRVEVRVQKVVSTFFAGIVRASQIKVSARAVGKISTGTAPGLSFVALNGGDEKHTLVVRSSGTLTVNNTIHVNSLSDDDGFDIFGPGGSITAPQIMTHEGWEKKVGTSVIVGTTTCEFPTYSPASYPTKQTLVDPMVASTEGATDSIHPSGALIQAGHIIQVQAEWMYVTGPDPNKPGNMLVTRGFFDTVPVAHAVGNKPPEIMHVIESPTDPTGAVKVAKFRTRVGCPVTGAAFFADPFAGLVPTPSLPTAACPTGSGASGAPKACGGITGACATECTMPQGTYYGGICVGKTKTDKNGKVTCDTTCPTGGNITVHLDGVYILIGGGLYVCGGNNLDAPHVLIYNTSGTNSPLKPVHIETTGRAVLGPGTSGAWSGLTVYQPETQVLTDTNCDNRNPDEWDIGLVKSQGGLNDISGTIYAPHWHALFGDSMSGTATLAVMTGCIFIDGADSTFNFDPGGLFGTGGVGLDE